MSVRIYQRRGTSADWSSANPILADGEIGYDTTTKQYKIGDGLTQWNNLGYNNAEYKTITANYTIQPEDFGTTILVNSANPVIITVPQNTTESLPVGYNVKVMSIGNGKVSVQSEKETVPMTWDWDWNRDHFNRLAAWEWTQDIGFGDGKFVIAGYYGTFSVSDDGKDFQNIITPISSYWGMSATSIDYGNGVWVAGPYYGAEGFAYVSKDLKKWDIVETGAPRDWNGSYGAGFVNGRFILGHSDGKFTVSTDGYVWSTTTAPDMSFCGMFAYGNYNGTMMYIAHNGYSDDLMSTDAITWTTTTMIDLGPGPGGTNEFPDSNGFQFGYLDYHNGKWLTARSYNNQVYYFTSTDMMSWTTVNFGTTENPQWTFPDDNYTGNTRSTTYDDGVWFISGYRGNSGPSWNNGSYSWLPSSVNYMSTDLITWNSLPEVSPATTQDWAGGIAYGNNTWVIAGYYNNNTAYYKPETNIDAVEIHNAGSLDLSKNSYVNLEKIGNDKWFAESTSGLNNVEKLPIAGGEFNKIDMSKISSGETYSIEPLSQVKHVMIPLNDTLPVGTEIEILNTGEGLVRVLGEFDTDFLGEWNGYQTQADQLGSIYNYYADSPSLVYGDGMWYFAAANSTTVSHSQDLINWTSVGENIAPVARMLWNDAYKSVFALSTDGQLSYSIDRGMTWTTAIMYEADLDETFPPDISATGVRTIGSFTDYFKTDGHNTFIAAGQSYSTHGHLKRIEYVPQGDKKWQGNWTTNSPVFMVADKYPIHIYYSGAYSPAYANGVWTVGGYYGAASISRDSGRTWERAVNAQGNYQGGISGTYSYLGYNSFGNQAYGQVGLGGSYGENITSTDGYTWYIGGGYPVYQFIEEKQWVNDWGSYSYGNAIEGPQGLMIHPMIYDMGTDMPYSYDGTKQMSIGMYPVYKWDGDPNTGYGNSNVNTADASSCIAYGNDTFAIAFGPNILHTKVEDYVKIITPSNNSHVLYNTGKAQIMPWMMNGTTDLTMYNRTGLSHSQDNSLEKSNPYERMGSKQKSTIKPHGKAKIVKSAINTWEIYGDLQ